MVNLKKYLYIITLPLVLILASCDKSENVSSEITIRGNSGSTNQVLLLSLDTSLQGFVSADGEQQNPTPLSYSVTQNYPDQPCSIQILESTGETIPTNSDTGITYEDTTVGSPAFMVLTCSDMQAGQTHETSVASKI